MQFLYEILEAVETSIKSNLSSVLEALTCACYRAVVTYPLLRELQREKMR